MTNLEKIRNMTEEELTDRLLCPYDTAGEPEELMPCMGEFVGPERCSKCIIEWLNKEAK